MKSIVYIIFLLLSLPLAGQSQNDIKKETIVRKIAVGPFTSIEATADVHILLLDSDMPGVVYLEGDSTYFDDIRIEVIEGALRITPRSAQSFRKKFIIQVPVSGISRITAVNKANIISLNTLQSAGIHIQLDEQSTVALQSTGPVSVSAAKKQ